MTYKQILLSTLTPSFEVQFCIPFIRFCHMLHFLTACGLLEARSFINLLCLLCVSSVNFTFHVCLVFHDTEIFQAFRPVTLKNVPQWRFVWNFLHEEMQVNDFGWEYCNHGFFLVWHDKKCISVCLIVVGCKFDSSLKVMSARFPHFFPV